MGIAERRERDKQRRRADIIEAAERVFFSGGIAAATMDDVAEAAEVSKGTLYLYFKSKEDLHHAVVLRGMAILQRMFEEAVDSRKRGLEKIEAIGQAYFQFSRDYPDYFNALLQFESSSAEACAESGYAEECARQSNRTFAICTAAVQAGVDDGTIRADVDPTHIAVTLYGLSTGLLQVLSLKKHMIQEASPETLVETFFDLIYRSLRAQ
jgi:AcrR family transcriptional regulator